MMRLVRLLCLFALTVLIHSRVYAQEPGNIRTLGDSRRAESLNKTTANDPDGEATRLSRWMWRMEPRLLAGGTFPKADILLTELERYEASHSSPSAEALPNTQFPSGQWTPVGPFGFEDPIVTNGGSGRVGCIRFHPFDTNTIFIGTPDGGLWKTTNAGDNWTAMTDQIPCLGVSDIAIDPKNPNVIYIATGDADGPGMYGNPYSYGVLKSNNGGRNWNATGLVLDQTARVTVPRILISPTNSNTLLAAVYGGTTRGIQKSTDGGVTWEVKDGGSIYDIKYNPSNASIVYASGYGNFRRSTDGGETWTTIKSVLPVWPDSNVTRTAIGVSAADPNVVYVAYVNHANSQIASIYRSNDRGLTFAKASDAKIDMFGQFAEYNLVLSVSPVDANVVIMGAQQLARSTDGAKTWSSIDNGGNDIHVDNHALVFTPKGGLIYSGNDGGIARSDDGGSSWTDLSKNLQITQFYRMSSAAQCSETFVGGAQDNGILGFDRGTWWHPQSGADGGNCVIDYSDPSIVYTEWQYGWLMRSNDGGSNGVKIQPPGSNGSWIMPYALSPKDPKTIFAAYEMLYRSSDRGAHWDRISSQIALADNFKSLAIAPSNDSVIYVASYLKIFRTTDQGVSWKNITAGTPSSDTAAIFSIAVSPTDPNRFWLTFAGYTDHEHVYQSTDGGASYTNITGTLPNVPTTSIVCQKGNNALYIGTDIGVFSRDSATNDWVQFSSGLPRVSVSELELHEGSGALRAATFGRGVWQTPLRDLAKPDVVTLVAPATGAVAQTVRPSFSWNALARRRNFFVQIAKDSLFSQVVLMQDSLYDTTTTFATKLEAGTKYFWRVRASNLAGDGAWSEVRSFVTAGTNDVRETPTAAFEVYPNPTSDALHISGIASAFTARVFDITGRMMLEQKFWSQSASLELPFPVGLYAIEIVTSDGMRYRRIIQKN
jgi:photosystem II stability/assembly factor-like uncharacterized protein